MSFIIFEKVRDKRHKWTHRNTNFPLHAKGVNVKRCFYLIIINLKDYSTWQTADEVFISSLMFPLSPSLTSSSVFLLLFSFQNVLVTHFLTFRNCWFLSVSLFSSVSKCCGLHLQERCSTYKSYKTMCVRKCMSVSSIIISYTLKICLYFCVLQRASSFSSFHSNICIPFLFSPSITNPFTLWTTFYLLLILDMFYSPSLPFSHANCFHFNYEAN